MADSGSTVSGCEYLCKSLDISFMRFRYLAVVVLVACFFRSVNLEVIPLLHWDEGANLDVTLNLLEGRAQMFALKYSFFPHPPLFFVLASSFVKLFGPTILSLRIFSVTLSVATTVLVYLSASRLFGEKKAFVAGLIYALNPIAVYWNRMGMVNNQVVFLSILSLYLYIRFLQDKEKKMLYLSAFTSGLCAITGVIGFSAIFALYYLTLRYAKKNLPLVIATSLAAPITFTLAVLYAMPEYVIYDLMFLVERINIKPHFILLALFALYVIYVFRWFLNQILDSIRKSIAYAPLLGFVVMSVYALLVLQMSDHGYRQGTSDYLLYVLCIGFLLKPVFYVKEDEKKRPVLVYFTAYALFLFASSRVDHMAMVLYPYLPILACHLLAKLYNDSKKFLAKKSIIYVFAVLILVYHPVFVSLYHSLAIISGDTVAKDNLAEHFLVSDYINNITGADSVVVGYWLSHMINADLCSPEHSVAYDRRDTFYHSGGIPRDRFVVNCSLRNADAVILSDSLVHVLVGYDAFDEFLSGISSWDMEYVGGHRIYVNPLK